MDSVSPSHPPVHSATGLFAGVASVVAGLLQAVPIVPAPLKRTTTVRPAGLQVDRDAPCQAALIHHSSYHFASIY